MGAISKSASSPKLAMVSLLSRIYEEVALPSGCLCEGSLASKQTGQGKLTTSLQNDSKSTEDISFWDETGDQHGMETDDYDFDEAEFALVEEECLVRLHLLESRYVRACHKLL